jgi:hypothetical protein
VDSFSGVSKDNQVSFHNQGEFPLIPKSRYMFVIGVILVSLLFTGPVIGAEQSPSMPQAFYGLVMVGTQSAPSGIQVEARGNGVLIGIEGNPVSTGADGSYGGPGSFDPKLIVQGTIPGNSPIEFYVAGVKAQCEDIKAGTGWTDSTSFKPAENTQINLKIDALPEGNVTEVPTTSVTQYVTTARTSSYSGGGGGGGGGGGSYSSSVSEGSPAVVTSKATTVQTIAGNITQEQITTVTPGQNDQVEVQAPVTTMVPISPTVQSGTSQQSGTSLPWILILEIIITIGIIGAVITIVFIKMKGHL